MERVAKAVLQSQVRKEDAKISGMISRLLNLGDDEEEWKRKQAEIEEKRLKQLKKRGAVRDEFRKKYNPSVAKQRSNVVVDTASDKNKQVYDEKKLLALAGRREERYEFRTRYLGRPCIRQLEDSGRYSPAPSCKVPVWGRLDGSMGALVRGEDRNEESCGPTGDVISVEAEMRRDEGSARGKPITASCEDEGVQENQVKRPASNDEDGREAATRPEIDGGERNAGSVKKEPGEDRKEMLRGRYLVSNGEEEASGKTGWSRRSKGRKKDAVKTIKYRGK